MPKRDIIKDIVLFMADGFTEQEYDHTLRKVKQVLQEKGVLIVFYNNNLDCEETEKLEKELLEILNKYKK